MGDVLGLLVALGAIMALAASAAGEWSTGPVDDPLALVIVYIVAAGCAALRATADRTGG